MLDNLYSRRKLFFWLMLVVTFIFGLNPKDFDGSHIPIITQSGELSFNKYSVATIEANWFDFKIIDNKKDTQNFEVTINITKIPNNRKTFSVIFSINSSNGNNLFLMGQWNDEFIIMSGDDFSNGERKPRLSIPLNIDPDHDHSQNFLIEIRSSSDHTEVSVNKKQSVSSKNYIVPNIQGKTTILLGNTLNRKHGWSGTLKEFTLSNSISTESNSSKSLKKIINCCHQNKNEQTITNSKNLKVAINNFNQTEIEQEFTELVLQSPFKVLDVNWLTNKQTHSYLSLSFLKDILINFIGFIPISIAILMLTKNNFDPFKSSTIAVFAIALVSFFIESAQAFIPSRTSSIIDLSVNCLSGLFAVLVYMTTSRKLRVNA